MKVKDLIEQLKKLDPELEVVHHVEGYGYSKIEALEEGKFYLWQYKTIVKGVELKDYL